MHAEGIRRPEDSDPEGELRSFVLFHAGGNAIAWNQIGCQPEIRTAKDQRGFSGALWRVALRLAPPFPSPQI
jgi:hypothetical protein